MSEPVLWMQNGAVGVLTINRPETRNAVSDADVLDALLAALDRADGDPAVRVIVLTGAGAAFSAGGNVKAIQAGLVDRLGVAGTRDFYRHNIQRLTERFEAMDTPSIAAVNGPAMGLGCDLACMCDLRLAAPQARFAMSFVKLGLVPGDGGALLLPRIVGFAKASEMILTGDRCRRRPRRRPRIGDRAGRRAGRRGGGAGPADRRERAPRRAAGAAAAAAGDGGRHAGAARIVGRLPGVGPRHRRSCRGRPRLSRTPPAGFRGAIAWRG